MADAIKVSHNKAQVEVQRKQQKKSEESNYCQSTENESVIDNTKMIKAISTLLNEIILENSQNSDPSIKEVKTGFTCKKPPSITIDSYLDRIIKYSHIEESTLIITLIYIDRVCDMNNIQINNYNIHRLIIASVLTAIKYNEDDYYANTFYAKVGGVTLQEINSLEFELIKLLKYSLFVDTELYNKYKMYLLNYQN